MPDARGRTGLDRAGRDLTGNPGVVVRDVELLAAGWHVLRRTTFDYRHADGHWSREQRETYDRGNGATILLYDLVRRTVLLTRQFRFPVYVNGHPDGMLVETAAGLLDHDDPATAIRRETEEELGVQVGEMEHVMDVWMSPGSVTEQLHVYAAPYTPASRTGAGGGLPDDGEDIDVLELPFDQALDQISTGRIADAKTAAAVGRPARALQASPTSDQRQQRAFSDMSGRYSGPPSDGFWSLPRPGRDRLPSRRRRVEAQTWCRQGAVLGRSALWRGLPPHHTGAMTPPATHTARFSAPLATSWFVTALVVGSVGFLLFALSDGSGDRMLGAVLAGAGVLAGATGATVLTSGDVVRPWSLALSGSLVVLGLVAAAVALSSTPSFVADVVLLGLPPLVGGAVTGFLALRR